MDYRELGGAELRVSAICLGTMTGGSQNSERDAHEHDALDAGVNFIDTAELYPSPPMPETQGRTEKASPRSPCAKKDGLLACSPLVQGYLRSKYQQGALPEGSRKQLYDRLQRYGTPNAAPAIDAYGALACRHDMDPAQNGASVYVQPAFCHIGDYRRIPYRAAQKRYRRKGSETE